MLVHASISVVSTRCKETENPIPIPLPLVSNLLPHLKVSLRIRFQSVCPKHSCWAWEIQASGLLRLALLAALPGPGQLPGEVGALDFWAKVRARVILLDQKLWWAFHKGTTPFACFPTGSGHPGSKHLACFGWRYGARGNHLGSWT